MREPLDPLAPIIILMGVIYLTAFCLGLWM